MTQVINHNLGYKIVYNPGLDFDLGYKNKSEFFYYPGFKSIACVGYALEEKFPLMNNLHSNKFINLGNKRIQIYFYNLGQNHTLDHEQFYNLVHDL